MSGKANAVLWIGLLIVILNIVTKWPEFKSVIFSSSSPGSSGSSSSSGSGGSGFKIPVDPFIPSIPISIPV